MAERLSDEAHRIKFGRSETVPYVSPRDYESEPWAPSCDVEQYDWSIARSIYSDFVDQAIEDERLGYHAVFVTEHHTLTKGSIPSPNIMMSALAQRTNRIQICSAVNILLNRQIIHLAEEWGMLDLLSNGRLEVGVGRHGGQELFNESLQLVCTALYEREFVFNGKYHQYDKPLTVYPRAARAIPVWVAASSADTIVAAARLGCGLIAAETIPQSAEDGPAYQGWEAAVARYMDASHASGREASMANVIVVVDLCLAPTDAQAERMFRTGDDRDFYIEKTRALRAGAPEDVIQRAEAYRKSMNRLDSPTALVGAPHAVRQKLNELISKGATRFLLRVGALGYPRETTRWTMRAFAEEVAPEHFQCTRNI